MQSNHYIIFPLSTTFALIFRIKSFSQTRLFRCIGYQDDIRRRKEGLSEVTEISKQLPECDLTNLQLINEQFNHVEKMCKRTIDRIQSEVCPCYFTIHYKDVQ